jgi:Plasmid encoded RepA protein
MSSNDTKEGLLIKFPSEEERYKQSSLLETHLAIEAEDAWRTGQVGYICRALVQATLPYREPKGNPPAWGRTNGKVSLVIQPGYYIKQEEITVGKITRTQQIPVSLGYPYGSIPRLLLAWIGREVKQKKEREIHLGKSLIKFMQEIGINSATGGKNGSITRLREQMRRTFSAKIAILDNPDPKAINWRSDGFSLVDKSQIWWDTENGLKNNDSFDSNIVLSERFYNELITSPVPVDMRALRALKNSPSALDLYCFLTYRMFTLRQETVIPWEALMMQFGSETVSQRKFRQQFNKALKAVLIVYPEAKVDVIQAGLLLKHSKTSVRPLIENKA